MRGDDFGLSLGKDKTKVTIGDGHAETNRIVIGIDYTGTDQPTIRVTVTVQCGQTKTALLGSNTERTTVTGSDPIGSLNRLDAAGSDTLSWQSTSSGVPLGATRHLTVELKEFLCCTAKGDAAIEVLVEFKQAGEAFWSEDSRKQTFGVQKELDPVPGPKIHYFTVAPDFVLHSGSTPVEVSFLVTGVDSVSLFRNNQKVTHQKGGTTGKHIAFEWTTDELLDEQKNPDENQKLDEQQNPDEQQDPDKKPNPKVVVFADTPSITTVYRLEPRVKGKPNLSAARTVQVISPGWNRLALPQGYPTRLFAAPDFVGGAPRLYGIFVNDAGRAALYSSTTGIDDWQAEMNGAVPKGMETSPGVAFEGKLWLIGGSSVNDDAPSDRICRYGVDGDTGRRRWVEDEKFRLPERMKARAGHACLVVPVVQKGDKVLNELWVLGGYNSYTNDYFNDVWKYTVVRDEQGNPLVPEKKAWIEQSGVSPWLKRLRHAAAVRTVRTDPNKPLRTEVWIFGGSGSDAQLADLWSSDDKGTWSPQPAPHPGPGATLGAALVAVPSRGDASDQRLYLAGTFLQENVSLSLLYAFQTRNQMWEAEEVGHGWERFGGSEFYMQAVAFNRFIFLWSLHRDVSPRNPPRLNVLIPS